MSYDNETTLVLGHRGSGKSTWLAQHIEGYRPFILVDPLFDPKYEKLGLYKVASMPELLQLFKTGNPQRIYISPNPKAFDLLCGMVLARGNLTLVIDEVDQYQDNYDIPPYFRQILKIGRHKGVNVVMVARQPKEIHKFLRSQASRFIIFPLGGEDCRELEEHIGYEAKKVAMLKMQPGKGSEYLDYNFSTRESAIKNISFSA